MTSVQCCNWKQTILCEIWSVKLSWYHVESLGPPLCESSSAINKFWKFPPQKYIINSPIWGEYFQLWFCQDLLIYFQGPGGCLTNILWALQNILSKFVYCRYRTSYKNFKQKLCTCAQSMALGTRTKFQLEILTIIVISGIVYFWEIIIQWKAHKTLVQQPPGPWNSGPPKKNGGLWYTISAMGELIYVIIIFSYFRVRHMPPPNSP